MGRESGGGTLKYITLILPKLRFNVLWDRLVITINIIQHQISFLV